MQVQATADSKIAVNDVTDLGQSIISTMSTIASITATPTLTPIPAIHAMLLSPVCAVSDV